MTLRLAYGLAFEDLYDRDGLLRLDAAFLQFLAEADEGLRARLETARGSPPPGKDESELLIALAPHLEDFLARLFGIEAEARALAARHHELAPLYSVKRLFVQRRALHKVKAEDASPDGYAFTTELEFARQVTEWLKDEAAHAAPTTSEISAYIKSHSTLQIGRAADGLAEMGLLQVNTKSWGNRLIKRYCLPPEGEVIPVT